ncbi:MAG: hypothetical protein Q9201_007161 [Fulgogasparrea decipioides]
MAQLRPELKSRAIHSYQTNVFVTGRKPEHPPYTTNNSQLGSTAPPTPSSVGSPKPGPDSPAPSDQINAFTPVMPIKQEVIGSHKRALSVNDMVNGRQS